MATPDFTRPIPANLTRTSNPLLFHQWRAHLLDTALGHKGAELRRVQRESAVNAQLVWVMAPLLEQADAEKREIARELRQSRRDRRRHDRELAERARVVGERDREVAALQRQLREQRERCVCRGRRGQNGGGRPPKQVTRTLASTRTRRAGAKY